MLNALIRFGIVGLTAASALAAPAAVAQETDQQAGAVSAASAAAEQANVLDIINGSANYSVFANLLQKSGLAGVLAGRGPFTVFVPSNEAFANLPAGTVDWLLQPQNKARLAELVTAHILPGLISSNQWGASTHLGITLGGNPLAYVGGQQERVNNAPVMAKDIRAANGVVHVVGAPLKLPQAG
ncbi:fasciclin domain-containing protein [Pedomonas mirosovicensis]|uniref:fasciclin domain-containing protein n=1 Tax=Pedomonas mirosovicensis TaxID=2908641 RepID=UPI002169F454|nr:fasciclin domain-containing protein [Pedomonas mirosovicensis]MCH8683898.1 fasciclin domain-containing protein [Pedomonas mirosovicensis]